MTENISLADSVSQKLKNLRVLIGKKQIKWSDFALSSARLYLTIQKPRRAKTLLETIDNERLGEDHRAQKRLLLEEAHLQSTSDQKTCSLTMIVRDESANIADCLDTVDTVMDEMIICDTGSVDNTLHKAALYGVSTIIFPWDNDFSKARNAAVDRATCDWIFWLDADDRMDRQSAKNLQKFWRSASPQAAAFKVRSLTPEGGEVQFMQVRLFPRIDSLRFERRIHEQIMFAAKRAGIPFSRLENISILHTGYADNQLVYRKALRNKQLLQLECKSSPGDPTLLMNMGDCRLTLHEYEEAAECYTKICEKPDNFRLNSDVYVQAHINLAALYMKEKDYEKAEKYLLRSLFLDPTRIESHFQLGQIYLKQNEEKKAENHFLQAARTHPPLRLTAANNTLVRLNAVSFLVDIYIGEGRYAEAETVLSAAVESYPLVPRFYSQLGEIYRKQRKFLQAARYYSHSLQLSEIRNEQAYSGMAAIYEELKDFKSAEKYQQARSRSLELTLD